MSNTDWYGVVPSSWNISRLKNILIERNESNNPIKTDFILSLTNDRGVIPYSEKGAVGNNSKEDITGYKLAYPGDLVLNSMNVVIGSVGISNYFGCVSPVYYMLRPRNQNDSIEFYNYLFQTTELQNALKGYGNGILEIRMRIAMSKLNAFLLPKPDCRVQNKIVQKIKESEVKIDQLISNQQQQIEKLKEYKQSLISEIVTKGSHPNVEFKDSGVDWIGYIPRGWKVIQLKRIGKILNGSTPKTDNLLFWDGPIFWATPTDFTGKQRINVTTRTLTDLGYDSCNTNLVPKGSVLITCRAPIGNIAINEVEMSFNQGCKGIITSFDNRYLYYFLKCMNDPLNVHGQGTTFLEISTNSLSNFQIALPNEIERNQIADFLDEKIEKIDVLITNKIKKIDKLESYKKTLIYEYVTGKKDLS